MTESLTPSCSSDNDFIASAEDDDPPTAVCGREEPLEGCQLTYLRKTYSEDPADWKITQELIDHLQETNHHIPWTRIFTNRQDRTRPRQDTYNGNSLFDGLLTRRV